jgi:hypothetical protein
MIMSSPFDYVNEILYGKKNIIVDEPTEKEYLPFIVNRALSYHYDCILYANEMNTRPFLDKKCQNSFLINTVRSRKRPFAKWVKSEKSEDLECIKIAFNYSDSKAKDALRLLSEEQIQKLKELTQAGGLRK